MTDYTSIPLHIRCKGRNLIDPGYPMDDAKWWQAEENKTIPADGRGLYDRSELTEFQQQVYNYLVDEGETSGPALARHFGIPMNKLNSTMLGLSVYHPIYEFTEHNKIVFGVIDRTG